MTEMKIVKRIFSFSSITGNGKVFYAAAVVSYLCSQETKVSKRTVEYALSSALCLTTISRIACF